MLNPNFCANVSQPTMIPKEKNTKPWNEELFSVTFVDTRDTSLRQKKRCTILPQWFGENTHRGHAQDKYLCIENMFLFKKNKNKQMKAIEYVKERHFVIWSGKRSSIISSPKVKGIYILWQGSNFEKKSLTRPSTQAVVTQQPQSERCAQHSKQ